MTDAEAEKTTPEVKDEKTEQASSAAPVFGAAFGSGSGFGGFKGVTPPEKKVDDDEDDQADEEECKAEFKPVVQLEEVEASTGEEDETCLLDLKCKLYRYDNDAQEWKERGIGQAKFLQHNGNKKIRFLMRQEKTLKIRSNHLIMPGTKISHHAGNEKAWVWTVVDFADEEQKIEMFAIRFGSVERANEWKEQYTKCMDLNAALLKADGIEVPVLEEDETKKEVEEVADKVEKAEI